MLCSNTPMPAWVRVARPNKRRVSRQHRPKVCHAGNLMQNAMTKFLDVCTHKMKKWRQLVIRSVWLQPGCANQANSLDIQTASHRLQRAQKQGGHILSIHLSFVPQYLKAVRYNHASSSWFCCLLLAFGLFLVQVKAELKAVSREKPSQLFWTRWVALSAPFTKSFGLPHVQGIYNQKDFSIWFLVQPLTSHALLLLL